MLIAITLLAFAAGIACGLALRPGLDRRRRVRSAYAAARARRAATRPAEAATGDVDGLPVPRDYYAAAARERGSLAEGFGLKGATAGTPPVEPDPSAIPLPRDYYERETPEDEGLLSEGFGLKRSGGSQA